MHRDISVLHSGVVKEVADNGPFNIDAVRIRRCGAGEIHLRKVAGAIEEPMAFAGSVRKAAHDIPRRSRHGRHLEWVDQCTPAVRPALIVFVSDEYLRYPDRP